MSSTEDIPFVDLRRLHADLEDDLRAAFDRVVQTNGFILGEEVERFEDEFARYCGTAHCVGVASGTAALILALSAGGIGFGDEVLVPAHTFIASALSVVHAGATPVFCDVDDATGLMDPDAAAAAVSERTAAILPVHLYGHVCDMERLGTLAERYGLAIFEDAAQAHGATAHGSRAGSLGSAAGFSFYPSKNLGALGDGGAVCTDDASLAERVRELRNLGQRAKGEHVRIGVNERLDGLQAAMLRAKLPHLDGWNEGRRARAAAYQAALGNGLQLLRERPGTRAVWHVFPVRTEARDALACHFASAGIATGVHYSPAVHHQPPFRAAAGSFPAAETWARQELSLPMHPHLGEDQIHRIAETWEDFRRSTRLREKADLAVAAARGRG